MVYQGKICQGWEFESLSRVSRSVLQCVILPVSTVVRYHCFNICEENRSRFSDLALIMCINLKVLITIENKLPRTYIIKR